MREQTTTKYFINCTICKKEFSFEEKPYEYDFKCKNCIAEWKEPKRENFGTFGEYVRQLEDWTYSTKKKSSYDLWDENFKNDVWKEYKKDYKKNKTKLDRAWSIAYEQSDNESRSYFLGCLEELFEIM
jgi:hypothetical protein